MKQRNAKGQWTTDVCETSNRPMDEILASPVEGDIILGSRLGRKARQWCRWSLCPNCGRGRWLQWSCVEWRQDRALVSFCHRCAPSKYDSTKKAYASMGSDLPLCRECGSPSSRRENGREVHGLVRGLCARCYSRIRCKEQRDENLRLYGYTSGSPEQRKRNNARATGKSMVRHRERKLLVILAYGGKCECCGETAPEMLTIDHIDGNGASERKSRRGLNEGWNFYGYLIRNNFPKDNYRLLCFNCNRSAYVNGGVCSHQSGAKWIDIMDKVAENG